MKFGMSRVFDLTSHFQDVGHYVILYNKVLPPGESQWSVCQHLWSSVDQFLIYSIYFIPIPPETRCWLRPQHAHGCCALLVSSLS